MAGVQTVNVPIGTPKDSLKRFKHSIGSTTGIFQLTPVFYREVMPRAKMSVKKEDSIFYVRSNPFAVPTFAQYDFKFNRFFVPYQYVWPAWNDYKSQNLHYYPSTSVSAAQSPAIPDSKPWIANGNLSKMLVDPNNGFATVVSSGNNLDFTYVDSNNVVTAYKWTRMGVMAFKLLQNLGIQPYFRADSKTRVHILNLLAYGKVFLEYYYPSNYAYTSVDWYELYSAFTTDLKVVEAGLGNGKNEVYYRAILHILKYCTLTYFNNSTYYDMWDTPEGPNDNGSFHISSLLDPAANDIEVFQAQLPVMENNSGDPVFTRFAIQALQRASNFVRRYQLVGGNLIDRWLAYFGQKLQDSHRAIRYGETVVPLKVDAIACTSDSDNQDGYSSVVGDLAAKGYQLVNMPFEFENTKNTHGVFFILMSCQQDNYIVNVMDPNNLRVGSLEDYQGEYDSLCMTAVKRAEIFCSLSGQKNDDPDGVAGFLPMYYERALDRHILSGAFNVHTLGGDSLKGYFPRKFWGSNTVQSDIVHDLAFMHPQTHDVNGANLPFYDMENNENFMFLCEWRNVKLIDAKRPLSDVFDWDDEDENGTVEIDSNGVKVN